MARESEFYYPNRMGRIILLALEEVLGRNGANAVLKIANLSKYIHSYPPHNQDLAIPFSDLAALQVGLETAYGPRTGRGIALRVGRACFKYGLREFGADLGLTDLAFRLLPLPTRMEQGARALASLFNDLTDQRVRVEIGDTEIYWHIERCPLCWGRHVESPACSLAVGLLQEALYWVSSGKYFNVEETACIGNGSPTCTIVIHRTILG
ncbi:MAG: 4-vinyl reductase [Anaerolineales bacterium]|nr:4-vinyl reductase [Anaerolineales bacterium]MCX7609903.1 4-vinyl reductase [Anaerolineales bacterium]